MSATHDADVAGYVRNSLVEMFEPWRVTVTHERVDGALVIIARLRCGKDTLRDDAAPLLIRRVRIMGLAAADVAVSADDIYRFDRAGTLAVVRIKEDFIRRLVDGFAP